MNPRYYVLLSLMAVCTSFSGCATGTPDTFTLQQLASGLLGLASPEQVRVSDVNKAASNITGRAFVSFRAITSNGRRFYCATEMVPSLAPWSLTRYVSGKCQAE